MRARGVVLFVLVLASTGGCRPVAPVASAATIKAEDLPIDPATLNAKAAEMIAAGDRASLENALLMLDRAVATKAGAPVTEPSVALAYESSWRAAAACFWLAHEAEGDDARRAHFAERGIEYAKRALTANQNGGEGHYYLGLDLAYLARTKTVGALEILPEIARQARAALKIDEKIDHCGPARMLGTLLLRAPAWPTSIGDLEEAEEKLARAAELCPEHPGNQLYYGEVLTKVGRKADGKARIESALAAPENADWKPLLPIIRSEGEKLLQKLK